MSVIRYKGQDYAGSADDVSASDINYESGDELNPSEPAEVPKLNNKETLKTFAQKVSTAVKNVRYLFKMLGTTDISAIGDGTVTGAVDEVVSKLSSFNTAVSHRNTFRGKNLGTSYTAAQKAAVANGLFDDLYIGDYWVINGMTWRIVDIDYWWNSGDTACTTHHLVVMPDSRLYTAQMNETNITTGGYVGSKMYTENLENAKTLVYAAFGETAVLNHREYLTNSVSNGYPSAGAWYDSKVELPNEIMMYGSLVFSPAGDGSFVPTRYTIDKTQLALMAAHPRFINPARQTQWLRDVVSGANFVNVHSNGSMDYYIASDSRGVRPVFGLC